MSSLVRYPSWRMCNFRNLSSCSRKCIFILFWLFNIRCTKLLLNMSTVLYLVLISALCSKFAKVFHGKSLTHFRMPLQAHLQGTGWHGIAFTFHMLFHTVFVELAITIHEVATNLALLFVWFILVFILLLPSPANVT